MRTEHICAIRVVAVLEYLVVTVIVQNHTKISIARPFPSYEILAPALLFRVQ